MKKQQGFTLIELMIVVAIVGILAAIALPAYQTYTKKAKFSEVIAATGAVKTQVEVCSQENNGNIASCSISTAGADNGQYVASVDWGNTNANSITATAVNTNGLGGEDYILTATIASSGAVTWAKNSASTCIAAGIC
ncbi:pilin [Gallaecimonas pentaromativorans]|uniref:pilin n=1 Tax=Gallaecimonas pentaromativorans TaxID=584787 RepID=UPI003A90ADF8